jgi:hypothetical protein
MSKMFWDLYRGPTLKGEEGAIRVEGKEGERRKGN